MERPKLLIVEDDPQIGRLLKRFLCNFDCTVASNSADGVDFVRRDTFDAIITDWDCPGFSSGQLVVNEAKLYGIPLLIHTANCSVEIDGVKTLQKPCDIKTIEMELFTLIGSLNV